MNSFASPRLLAIVEGETEAEFVKGILEPHLVSHGFSSIDARLIGGGAKTQASWGICGWKTAETGIVHRIQKDKTCRLTTMVEYYGLPRNGSKAWSGRAEATNAEFGNRAGIVENAILQAVQERLCDRYNSQHFALFARMHEFEAILYSDCQDSAKSVGRMPDPVKWATVLTEVVHVVFR